jgi:zinc transporter ZupT
MEGIFFTSEALAAFVATGLISLAPNLLLFLMPNYAKGCGEASSWLSLGQAMGAGGLLADVFLHTLPESANNSTSGMYVLIGFVVFFAVDLLVRSVDERQRHNGMEKPLSSHSLSTKRSVVFLNLVADSLHNFTDGLAIGASYSIFDNSTSRIPTASTSTVWSTFKNHTRGGFATISICFHEIPHELSK